ncbi:olfactomedin-like protein 2A isoform X2 [Acipenser ruthenus]|uniref:olfactomedin-like protein 2A isoform X2 n=1 Tax=Acipenser ruthenus TaxID=7906 RepID=UPI002741969E|nr:olfactomedin-like protein 2A isoform X2 [Acipenser ruthenus]
MGSAALSVLACCVLQLTVGARHTTGQVMLSSSTAAVSERDCSCVCTLRRPSLEQCMLDRAPPSPKPLPAPGSKCRCQCEVTGFNPCETELRLEKLRRRSTDIDKVQGISVMLRQALENADIRRLSSNTNRVSTHLKTLEQGDQNLCNITLEQDRGAKVKEQAGAGKEHSSPSLSPSPALNHTTTSSRSEETRQTDRQGELSNTVCEDGCSGSLSAVSPPLQRSVFGRSGEGAWFSDPLSQDSPLYVAPLLFGSTLLEFRDMDVLARGEPLSPPHTLPASYSGSGHTVYNSSFYYLKAFTRTLIRYSLVQRCLCAWSELSELPSPSHGHGWQGHNEVTLGADEGGLWVAYPSLLEGELMLRRLDSEELLPRRGEGGEKAAWSTGLGRHRYGLCFLVCGVLYVLERGAESEGVVFHAFDSHTGSHTSPALPFPARPATTLLTQLSYNPRDRLLYGWDDGALLTYSLEFTY